MPDYTITYKYKQRGHRVYSKDEDIVSAPSAEEAREIFLRRNWDTPSIKIIKIERIKLQNPSLSQIKSQLGKWIPAKAVRIIKQGKGIALQIASTAKKAIGNPAGAGFIDSQGRLRVVQQDEYWQKLKRKKAARKAARKRTVRTVRKTKKTSKRRK